MVTDMQRMRPWNGHLRFFFITPSIDHFTCSGRNPSSSSSLSICHSWTAWCTVVSILYRDAFTTILIRFSLWSCSHHIHWEAQIDTFSRGPYLSGGWYWNNLCSPHPLASLSKIPSTCRRMERTSSTRKEIVRRHDCRTVHVRRFSLAGMDWQLCYDFLVCSRHRPDPDWHVCRFDILVMSSVPCRHIPVGFMRCLFIIWTYINTPRRSYTASALAANNVN